MPCKVEIHVGDIGTIYRVRVLDNGIDFDFSTADIMELIFLMPNNIVLHKAATMTTDGSPATQFFLEYQVMPGDGVGSPGEFHDNEGPLAVQAYLHFPDSSQFHSSIQTIDTDGQELRIFPNLD